MTDHLLELGDYSKPKPKGYWFNLDEWIQPLCIPTDIDFKVILDPKSYFITSGEAVTKGTVLEKDLWELYIGALKEILDKLEDDDPEPLELLRSGELPGCCIELQLYLLECWRAACQARYLVIHLTEARGPHLFLETDWFEGKIVCYPKNPRGVKF